MEPRVILQLDVRLHATFLLPLQSTHPIARFFERVLRWMGFTSGQMYRSKDLTLYLPLEVPPSEISTVVRHATNLSAPDGVGYAVDRWTYEPGSNTYRAWHHYNWERYGISSWADGPEDFEDACERFYQEKFGKYGFTKTYPTREAKGPYRVAAVHQSA